MKIIMNSYVKNSLKVAGLASLLGLAFLCGKKHGPGNIRPSLNSSHNISNILTKLPGGEIKVDYESISEQPFKHLKKLNDIVEHEYGIPIWVSDANKRFDKAGDLEGSFFQLNSNALAPMKESMNPNDGVPEAFIVPKLKRITRSEKLMTDKNDLKYQAEDQNMLGFSSEIFVDKDFLDRVKNPSLYLIEPVTRRMRFVRKMNFKEKEGVFTENVDTEDILMKTLPVVGIFEGYCLSKDYSTMDMNGIVCSRQPAFLMGDFGEDPKYDMGHMNSTAFTIFGLYDSNIKQLADSLGSMTLTRDDANDLISKCFDKSVQERLTGLYEKAKIRQKGYTTFTMNLGRYGNCMITPIEVDSSGESKPFTMCYGHVNEIDSTNFICDKYSDFRIKQQPDPDIWYFFKDH